jgi:hypothetical protein
MTADQPGAGRTCEPTCGSLEWCEHLATGVYYCTPGCAEAGRPLNPDTRPVEQDREGNPRIYPCDVCGTMRSKPEGGTIFTLCDECWDKEHRKPRPVERCSCPEALRYEAALESIERRCRQTNSPLCQDVIDIARRALALGGETET